MIDRRIEELMWLEIDDSISPNDRRKLHTYMESHGEALEHFEKLRQMTMLFGQVGEIDPPPELRQRILQSLETAPPPAQQVAGRITTWDRVREFFTARPVLKVATAAVMGMFVGIIGYHVLSYDAGVNDPLDISQLRGTIDFSSVDQSKPVLNIRVPGTTGTLSLHRVQARVLTHLDIRSEGEIEIVLGYGGRALGFSGGNLSNHPSNQVTIEDRKIRVRNKGEGTYSFMFELYEDPEAPFLVKVMSEGEVLLDREISPAHPSGNR